MLQQSTVFTCRFLCEVGQFFFGVCHWEPWRSEPRFIETLIAMLQEECGQLACHFLTIVMHNRKWSCNSQNCTLDLVQF